YQVTDRQVDKDILVARVTKELFFDGVPQVVFTLYDQHGAVVYSLDFWADADVSDSYGVAYEQIIDGATVYSETAAEVVEPYYWIYDFYGPGDLFTIEVPTPWRYEYTEGDTAIVDTFYSPDEHAVVQNVTYDDGEVISREVAGAFALELLKQYYAADIVITDDQVQSDGSERLTWYSPSGDYSGISFFETRGTTFLLFSTLWDNPYEADYLDTLNYIISTYDIP
ncbi:MAG: hypothetical protein L0322_32450, partial [Chloroflexi bacterium]|nr:hypothetical protein [Chloroflexota bacterium]